MKFLSVLGVNVLMLWLAVAGVADQTAIAEDGREVLLKDDGTWEYVKEETEAKQEFHFRKTRWGMTKAEVKKTKKGKPVSVEENYIGYESKVMSMECYSVYIFTEDRLVRVGL